MCFGSVILVMAAACGREPLDWVCPDVGYGDLVLTEIRGPQTGSDSPDWFEIYNASDRPLDLYGAQFFIRRLNGENPRTIIVRDESVVVEPGAYVVLGQTFPGEEPAHIDYGYAQDFPVGLYDTAAIDILACGEVIDRVEYRRLPRDASLALDGALEPSADVNQSASDGGEDSSWCADPELQADTGLVGTPRESNRVCPEP